MKKFTRILAAILCAVLVLSALPISAFADGWVTVKAKECDSGDAIDIDVTVDPEAVVAYIKSGDFKGLIKGVKLQNDDGVLKISDLYELLPSTIVDDFINQVLEDIPTSQLLSYIDVETLAKEHFTEIYALFAEADRSQLLNIINIEEVAALDGINPADWVYIDALGSLLTAEAVKDYVNTTALLARTDLFDTSALAGILSLSELADESYLDVEALKGYLNPLDPDLAPAIVLLSNDPVDLSAVIAALGSKVSVTELWNANILNRSAITNDVLNFVDVKTLIDANVIDVDALIDAGIIDTASFISDNIAGIKSLASSQGLATVIDVDALDNAIMTYPNRNALVACIEDMDALINLVGIENIIGIIGTDTLIQQLTASGGIKDILNTLLEHKDHYTPFITNIINSIQSRINALTVDGNAIAGKDEYDLLTFNAKAVLQAVRDLIPTLTELENLGDDGKLIDTTVYIDYLANVEGVDVPKNKTFHITVATASGVSKIRAAAAKINGILDKYLDYSISSDSIYVFANVPTYAATLLKVIYEEAVVKGIEDEFLQGLRDEAKAILLDLYTTDAPDVGQRILDVAQTITLEDLVALLEKVDVELFERAYNKVIGQKYVATVLGYIEQYAHVDVSALTLNDFIEKAGDIPTIERICEVVKNKTGVDVLSYLPIPEKIVKADVLSALTRAAQKAGVDIDFREILDEASESGDPLAYLYNAVVAKIASAGSVYNKVKSRALSLADRLLASSYAQKFAGVTLGNLYEGNGVFMIPEKTITVNPKAIIERVLNRFYDRAYAKLVDKAQGKLGTIGDKIIAKLDRSNIDLLLSYFSEGSVSMTVSGGAKINGLYCATFVVDETTVLKAFVPAGTDLSKVYPYEEGYDSSLGWKIIAGKEEAIDTYTQVMPAYDVTLELTVVPAIIIETNYPTEQVVDYTIDDTTSTDEVTILVESAMPAEANDLIKYTFTRDFIESLIAANKALVLRSADSYGDVTVARFDATALSEALATAASDAETLILTEEITEKSAKQTKFDFTFDCGNVTFTSGVVTLTLPFDGVVPTNDSRVEETFVYVIDSTGTRLKTTFSFDTAAGTITFVAPHFSYFEVITESFLDVALDGENADYIFDDEGDTTTVTVTTVPEDEVASIDLVFAKNFLEGQTKNLVITLSDGTEFLLTPATAAALVDVFGTADRLKISAAVTHPAIGDSTYVFSLTDQDGTAVTCTGATLSVKLPDALYVNTPPAEKTYVYVNGTLTTDYTVITGTTTLIGLTVSLTDTVEIKNPALFNVDGDSSIVYFFDGTGSDVDVISAMAGITDNPYVNITELFFVEEIARGKGLRIVLQTDGVTVELDSTALATLYARMQAEGIDTLTILLTTDPLDPNVYDFSFGVHDGINFTPLDGGVAFSSGEKVTITLPATAPATADVLPYLYIDGVDCGLVTIVDGFVTFETPHFSTFEIRDEVVLLVYLGAGIGGGQLLPAYYTVTADDTAKVVTVQLASVLPVFALNTVDVIFLKDFAINWYGYSLEITSAMVSDRSKVVLPASGINYIADALTPTDYVDFYAAFGPSNSIYQSGYVCETDVSLISYGAVAATVFTDVDLTLPIDAVYNGTDEKTFVETIGFTADGLLTFDSVDASSLGYASMLSLPLPSDSLPLSLIPADGSSGTLVPYITGIYNDSKVSRDTTNGTVTITSDNDNRLFSIVNKYYLKGQSDYSLYTDGVKTDETSTDPIFTGFLTNDWYAEGEQLTVSAPTMLSGYEDFALYAADFFKKAAPTTSYLTLSDIVAGTTKFTMPASAVTYKLSFSVTNYHIYVYVNGAKVDDITYKPGDAKDTVFGKLTTSVVTTNKCDAPDASFKEKIGTAPVLYYFATKAVTPATVVKISFYGLDGTSLLKSASYTPDQLAAQAYRADIPAVTVDDLTVVFWKDAQGKDLADYDWNSVSGTEFKFYATAVSRTFKITAGEGLTVTPPSEDGYKKGQTITVSTGLRVGVKLSLLYTTEELTKTLEFATVGDHYELQFEMPAADVDLKLVISPMDKDVTYTDKDGNEATGKIGQTNELRITVPAGKLLTSDIPSILADLSDLTLADVIFNADGSITLVYRYSLKDGDDEQKALADVTAAMTDSKYATRYFVNGNCLDTADAGAEIVAALGAEIAGWSDPVEKNLVFATFRAAAKDDDCCIVCWILLILAVLLLIIVILYLVSTFTKNKKVKRFFLFRFAAWVMHGIFAICEVLAAGVCAIGKLFGFREEDTFGNDDAN